MTIGDTGNNRVYDLWQVQIDALPASGGPLPVSWAGVTRLHGSGVLGEGDATAARFSNFAGRVREEELEAGRIRHALFLVIPCDDGHFVFPARQAGSHCDQMENAPPMGTRLQLDYSDAEINALPVPAWKKTLLRAMADYGMFIGDTGTENLFSVERESGLEYTSLGHSDRWLGFADRHHFKYWSGEGGVFQGDIGSGVDWRRLRVIAPCVSRQAC